MTEQTSTETGNESSWGLVSATWARRFVIASYVIGWGVFLIGLIGDEIDPPGRNDFDRIHSAGVYWITTGIGTAVLNTLSIFCVIGAFLKGIRQGQLATILVLSLLGYAGSWLLFMGGVGMGLYGP